MIPALIGAAVALGSAIYGGIKSAKARKQQQSAINDYTSRNEAANKAWFNQNYYSDYLQQADVQSALGALRERLRENNKRLKGTQAMSGGTHEALLASQNEGNRSYADAIRGIAGQATDYKRNVYNTYLQNYLSNNQNALGLTMGMYDREAQSANQFSSQGMQAGMGLVGQSDWLKNLGNKGNMKTPVQSPTDHLDYSKITYDQYGREIRKPGA